jgi:predicted nucleic acid-binding protein
MTTYLDASALVPIYVTERFSRAARSIVRAAGQVPFTAIHQLEVQDVFELLLGRDLITQDEWRPVHMHLQDDLENQRLTIVSLDLDRVFADARELSRRYTAKLLARSLGLLHVAAHMICDARGSCPPTIASSPWQRRVV